MGSETETAYSGVGIRGVAATIDWFVWLALLFVASYLVALVSGNLVVDGSGMSANLAGTASRVSVVLWLGLVAGYHTVLEWQFGWTVGKYLVGIRATDEDGSPLTLESSVVRNVLRFVDVLPVLYLVGIVLMTTSDREQRLGDRLGDSVVVRT